MRTVFFMILSHEVTVLYATSNYCCCYFLIAFSLEPFNSFNSQNHKRSDTFRLASVSTRGERGTVSPLSGKIK
jgi:hypothetical protein